MEQSISLQTWKGVIIGCVVSIVLITIVFRFSKLYPYDYLSGIVLFFLFGIGGMIAVVITKTETLPSTIYIGFIAGTVIGIYFALYSTIDMLYFVNNAGANESFVKSHLQHNMYSLVFMAIWNFLVIVSINTISGAIIYGVRKAVTHYKK